VSENKKLTDREVVKEYLESRYPIPLVRMFIKDTDAWAGKDTWDGGINENGDLDPKVASEGYEIWLVETRYGVERYIADMFSPIRREAISLIYREYGINELTLEYIAEHERDDCYKCWFDGFSDLDGGLDKKALREDIELYAIIATEEPINDDN